ncbi:MAG: TerC family protein [Gemmataceae bacterium]|nr:TerC family protein [Gemmataceae bacterium]
MALVALTAMEIVLGIDNVIFIAVSAGRLPKDQQARARRLGLIVALGTRLLLLFALSAVASLDKAPAFKLSWFGIPPEWLPEKLDAFTWRDAVMVAGGVFLIYKATLEIHYKLEGHEEEQAAGTAPSFASILWQIAVLDLVFSLDSVITAVGMAPKEGGLWVMVTAMVLSMLVMLVFAGPVSDFVARHPTVKMLALSFLILIGVLLVADGFAQHINKGYIYFAMAFSFAVEMLNLRLRSKGEAVKLKRSTLPEAADPGKASGPA